LFQILLFVRAPLEQDQRVKVIAIGHPLLDQTGPP